MAFEGDGDDHAAPMPRRTNDPVLLLAIGARIKALRLRAGLTQEGLGERVGLAAHSISRFESGDLAPTLSTAAALAKAVGTRLPELVDVEPAVQAVESGIDGAELLKLFSALDEPDRVLVIGLARLAWGRRR